MSYYDTIEEDLTRARAILARGKDAVWPNADRGTIYGGDTYAAYKLLESFVAEIEEYQRSFELYDTASMALMHAYKAAHPEVPENGWPDATKVNLWAAEQLERLRGVVAAVALSRDPERLAEIQAVARRVRAGDLDGFEPVPPEDESQ